MITLGIEHQWKLGIGLIYKGSEVESRRLSGIAPADMHQFYMIEETGNNLPTFSIEFSATEAWKRYWNENSHLKLSMSAGTSSKKIIDSRVAILAKDVTDVGNGRFKYSAQGVYVGDKNATVMCQTPYIQTLGPSTGTECLEACAKKFFSRVTNKAKSSGNHAWYQGNQSYKKFMDHVVRHSYIDKSFVTVGITMNGEYIIIDTAKECKGKEAWVIGGSGATGIPLISVPTTKSRSGALNTFGGYGLDLPIVSAEHGICTNYSVDIDLGLTGKKPPETGNVQRRTLAPVYFSGSNEDAGFCKAEVNYDYGQLLLTMEVFEMTTNAMDKDVKICDVIKAHDTSSTSSRMNQDSSGKYLVGKVVRGISGGMAKMSFQATRDSGMQQ